MDGTLIKQAREARGLSQAEVARLTGIAPEHLNRLERGKLRNVTIKTLLRIATALDTTVKSLIPDELKAA